MKRFTEALKWRDPWFSNLSPDIKLAWLWLLDNCDHAGTIDLSFKHLQFDTGYTGTEDELFEKLSDKVVYINSRYFIVNFLDFQYSNFETNKSNPVKSAKDILSKYGITYPVSQYVANIKPSSSQHVPNMKPICWGKEQEQDKDQYQYQYQYKEQELDKEQYQVQVSKSLSELSDPEEIDKFAEGCYS